MNKMTAANLAVVFGPNLAWSNDKTMVRTLLRCRFDCPIHVYIPLYMYNSISGNIPLYSLL